VKIRVIRGPWHDARRIGDHAPVRSDSRVLTVHDVIPSTPTTRIIRLDLGGLPFAFEAGQAALVGPADVEARVPYSIASSPLEAAASGTLDFLLKIEPSGQWGQQFPAVAPGMRLGIQGPYGSFVFPARPVERHFVFIAGGTGIAPIRAMIVEARLRRQQGQLRLLYSAKTADDFAYLPELGEIAAAHGLDRRLHVTRQAAEPNGRATTAATGRITAAQLAPLVDNRETLCFVCGPESMVAEVPRMLMELGIDRSRVRIEEW
jgi:ferredoxin-NADP reductase